ncbi:uncharacterized protein LOC141590123 [Silene latifolia]|uniref:uncharacterized protein LOC141590123 n=1 Tax=Silene latifolia TaxID=37657 RepID=UPI003D787D2E
MGEVQGPPKAMSSPRVIGEKEGEDELVEIVVETPRVIDEPTKVVEEPQQQVVRTYVPPIPFPQRLARAKLEQKYGKFMDMMKGINITMPFIDAVKEIPSYGKFLKELISNKNSLSPTTTVNLSKECSAILMNEAPQKLEDPGSFSIPCKIGTVHIERALCDLGASISLMPLKIFKKLKGYELSPTRVSLQLADRSVRYPIGLVEDVPLKVGKLAFPCDFYAMKEPSEEKSCYMIDVVEEWVDMKKFDEDKGLQGFLEGKVKDCKEHREYALAMEATVEEDPDKGFESLRGDGKKEERSTPPQVIVHTDHTTLRHLLIKKESKPRLIRWILLLQEFDIEIRDKKGVENVVADHLSRLLHVKGKDGLPIDDSLPDDQLFALALMDVPWYADYVNYLVSGVIPHGYDSHKKKKFFHDLKQYFWEEPCLYKSCADGIIRRCIPNEEVKPIISHCHDMPSGGHGSSRKTAARVLQCGFYWPSLFHDVASYVKGCDKCQRSGNISKRHEMPMNYILEVEVFDVWGIDYQGPFPSSNGNEYILVAVDYVRKWVEAIPTKTCDAKSVTKLMETIIFPRFGVPRIVISDRGTHFRERTLDALLKKHGVQHRRSLAYHPQANGQAEISNREIKMILEKTPAICLVELEHKAHWAIRLLNFDLKSAGEKRLLDLNELEEFRLEAYESSILYKERTKRFHDKAIIRESSRRESWFSSLTQGSSCLRGSSSLSGRGPSPWSASFHMAPLKYPMEINPSR